jgi:hypothetical protein
VRLVNVTLAVVAIHIYAKISHFDGYHAHVPYTIEVVCRINQPDCQRRFLMMAVLNRKYPCIGLYLRSELKSHNLEGFSNTFYIIKPLPHQYVIVDAISSKCRPVNR